MRRTGRGWRQAGVADRVAEEVGRQLLAGVGLAGACLPREVKARWSSVVMASSRTGGACWALAVAGDGEELSAAARREMASGSSEHGADCDGGGEKHLAVGREILG